MSRNSLECEPGAPGLLKPFFRFVNGLCDILMIAMVDYKIYKFSLFSGMQIARPDLLLHQSTEDDITSSSADTTLLATSPEGSRPSTDTPALRYVWDVLDTLACV